MRSEYDIIVIGAGHAGCEAAVSAARMGLSVLLITMDLNKIAQMSCNPSIGGIAKGQIVREIDALGGFSGIVTDASTLQFRMLNRSKGPAMWSPRAQCDRIAFSQNWRWIVENTPNLYLWQDTVNYLDIRRTGNDTHIEYLTTSLGGKFSAKYYILTAGTFLNGKIFVGDKESEGGRVSEPSSHFITAQLSDAGISTSRMKTGTPPRVDIHSVDLSCLILQTGDQLPERFSFLPCASSAQVAPSSQKPCFIAHTNSTVHDILKSAFDKSPLFTGKIKGVGPRYCPSIEDKLRTFPDKDSHQIFLEPEGKYSSEYYLQGFSSSLPFETQLEALQHVSGFENVHLLRPAYAIEYDYFDPTLLDHTLRSRIVGNLYLAGQVNGTTGYEEAAAQGLVAGINAALRVRAGKEFILGRDTSYIGVLVDDLVSKGVDEPYRMFTSRAEYRIILRQDNADQRLTELSYSIGLASHYRYDVFKRKQQVRDKIISVFFEVKPALQDINPLLIKLGSAPLLSIKPLSELLLRPQVSLSDIYGYVPRGTRSALARLSRVPLVPHYTEFAPLPETFKSQPLNNPSVLDDSKLSAETAIKYKGYIEREISMAVKIKKLENLVIPEDFDYSRLTSISIESRIKLTKHKPRNIAEASRIPGVSPSDISVLLVYFGR